MSLHRLLCGLGLHHWARLAQRQRGCAVCYQQQKFWEDVNGLHGFWMDVPPIGKVEALGKSVHETDAEPPPAD